MANDWNRALVLASGRDADMGADFGGLFGSFNPLKVVRSVGKAVSGATEKLGKQIGKVPVVGKGLHAVYDLGPAGLINTTAKIASGANVSKTVMGHFKGQLNSAREVAPYVQTVVSVVPGVGQGVSGAIGAGVALSRGRPITEAILEGARGALPGGPVAAAAFDVAMAAAQGKPIDQVALQAIPLPPDQKKYVVQAAMAAKDIAQGKNVAHSVYARGQSLLPAEAQKALQVGVAMASAKNLQDAMKKGAAKAGPALLELGTKAISKDPTFKAGLETLKSNPAVAAGFKTGAGIAKFKFSPTELNTIRGKLAPDAMKGFDIAMATHLGKLTSTQPLPKKASAKAKFGFYASRGMKVAPPKNKAAMQATLAADPVVRKGIVHAAKVTEIEKKLPRMSFFARLKYILTGK
jgi:hypothetical protein